MADYIMNDDRDAKDILIELRESTGMNRHQFCEYFEIPYMTACLGIYVGAVFLAKKILDIPL
jgi:hypothetical protein